MTRYPNRQRGSTALGRRIEACALAVLLSWGAAAAQERGRCVTVDVPSEYVTPDRVTHQPGSLKLCVERVHSPVSVLHKVYIDGHPVGVVQGRTGRSEGPATGEPYVQFRWNGRGQLLLVGYAWPERERMRTHILACNGASETDVLEACVPRLARTEIEDGFVLAATRLN